MGREQHWPFEFVPAGKGTYLVKSTTRPGAYFVDLDDEHGDDCQCRGFREHKHCKHIEAAREKGLEAACSHLPARSYREATS